MKKLIPLLLAVCLLFTGCSTWMDGYYSHVTPFEGTADKTDNQNTTVKNYAELTKALAALAESGTQNGIIWVPEYDQAALNKDLSLAIDEVKEKNPIAAYAVDEILCEVGSNTGRAAVSVNITYTHDKTEILKIRRVRNITQGAAVIHENLDNYADSVVIYFTTLPETDFVQLVEDYAGSNPQKVMEIPQVTVNIYPETGLSRVVELKFTYENSRERLRTMQRLVGDKFEAAALYVSGDGSKTEKLALMYTFLMERHDYQIETSITPAYSLLQYGKGDAKAFATVFAALCREAGLEAHVITGTRGGEAWYWNLVYDGGTWYHVDLLRCRQEGGFSERTDAEMVGYVWDYANYPVSVRPPVEPTPTETTAPEENG